MRNSFLLCFLLAFAPCATASPAVGGGFSTIHAMVPMRDGVALETTIYVPNSRPAALLPFIFERSPYGIPGEGIVTDAGSPFAPMVADGYLWVFQNIRGRFKSGGDFVMLRPPHRPDDESAVDETTDAYDTIAWLLKHVPGNNGRVGMVGYSYAGWTATVALLAPHPALRAVIEGATPDDLFANDDFHHNGAFRLAYGLEVAAYIEADKNSNTRFAYDRRDLYDWYLDLGPLSNVDRRHVHGKLATWTDFIAHPDRDAFWSRQAVTSHLRHTTVPTLHVVGLRDQEDPLGPVRIYEALEASDTGQLNFLLMGPWNHGGWESPGRSLGAVDFGSDTGLYFQRQVQAPWFAHYLHDKAGPMRPEAEVFETGSNQWRSYGAWPPRAGTTPRSLFLQAGRGLGFDSPAAGVDTYISDPASPVPFVPRPIEPLLLSAQWSEWMVKDQRFVDGRPDVLSYRTEPLAEDVVIAGDITARLYAATTGSDSDWVVKLIDAYPDGEAPPASTTSATAADLRGMQVIIASEILRARYRNSLARPEALTPGKMVDYQIDLHSTSHAFKAGHRIMVQLQSSWFPMFDRNPQRYVDSIYQARAEDFVSARQSVFRGGTHASAIVLPVVANAP